MVKNLSDVVFGVDYYILSELQGVLEKSVLGQISASYILLDEENPSQALGARLTYAPGQWEDFLKKSSSPELWEVEPRKVGYFKSLFLQESLRGQKLGPKMSEFSIQALKTMGAQAIACHSWAESPENSSQRYLKKIGFQKLKEHKLFWSEANYECVRCGSPPCQCAAMEMIYYI